MVAVENTPQLHNMVVCTLCSCYPWPVLGLPPVWYKSAPYRSARGEGSARRAARFRRELPADTEIRVWDSTAEIRYLVLPMRPAGTEGWSEEQLAELVTRDSMIGTGLPKQPHEVALMEGAHDMGGVARLRPGRAGAERAGVSRRMGRPRLRAHAGDGDARRLEHRHVALRPRGPCRPRIYLGMSYYQNWLAGLERLMLERGLVAADEIDAAHAVASGEAGQATAS